MSKVIGIRKNNSEWNGKPQVSYNLYYTYPLADGRGIGEGCASAFITEYNYNRGGFAALKVGDEFGMLYYSQGYGDRKGQVIGYTEA